MGAAVHHASGCNIIRMLGFEGSCKQAGFFEATSKVTLEDILKVLAVAYLYQTAHIDDDRVNIVFRFALV